MTTALPAATTAVASGATQGDVKNWITGVHDYLSGLFGTTGVTADALTALGVGGGVTSAVAGNGIAVSGATGAVTFSLGAAGANTVGTYILTNISINYGQSLAYGESCSVGTGNKQVRNDNIFDSSGDFSQGAIGVSGTWRFLGRSASLPAGTGAGSIMSIAVRIA